MVGIRIVVVVVLLAVPTGAFAWQMETVEPGQGHGIAEDNAGAPRFDSNVGVGSGRRSGGNFGIEPVRPGGRGPLFGDDRRPSVFGEGREPFYRPGSGRNCSGEGAGRVCF